MSEAALPTKLVIYPDPRLRETCAPVTQFDERLAALGEQMLKLMHANRGVGLAGPQVGMMERIFVCNPTGEAIDDRVYINPEILELTGAAESEEGCLSIPEVRVIVRRGRAAVMRAMDLQGRPIELKGQDLEARIWQHEIDHLDGRLIIDRMNATDKIATKKQIAQLEADYKKALKKG